VFECGVVIRTATVVNAVFDRSALPSDKQKT
jgi:hypothetical protein